METTKSYIFTHNISICEQISMIFDLNIIYFITIGLQGKNLMFQPAREGTIVHRHPTPQPSIPSNPCICIHLQLENAQFSLLKN